MITFPTTFPLPTADLAADEQANSIRTRMESGSTRQRRRFSIESLAVDVTWELNDEQMAMFTAFHKYKINLGNDWFEMQLPLGGGVQTHKVRFQEGKFAQKYQDVGHWEVTAKLDIEERYTFSEELLDTFLNIGSSETEIANFLAGVTDFHNCIHQTLPTNLN
jgi:hypothetical protein